MERLFERIKMADKALYTFQEVMAIQQPSTIERDAAIQRFEITFEAIWKAAKQWLFDIEGIDVGSPKGVIRACREVGVFQEVDAIRALEMVDDRNLTVHTYNETLAIEIFSRLNSHLQLLEQWHLSMKSRLKSR